MNPIVIIGLVLIITHSLFPPRFNPEHIHDEPGRSFVYSEDFNFSYYRKIHSDNPNDESYTVESSPATMDWTKYIMGLVLLTSFTSLACLTLANKLQDPNKLTKSDKAELNEKPKDSN